MRVMDQNFVPVVDDRHLFVGIVTRRDVIKFFYSREKQRISEEKGGSHTYEES